MHAFADLLIGQDNAEALVPLDVRRGSRGEPFAVKTMFGWSINGPVRRECFASSRSSHFVSALSVASFHDSDPLLSAVVEKFWEMEVDGLHSSKKTLSVNDKKVLDLWDRECAFVDGKFQLPIPWKPGADVPDNKRLALSRLRNLRTSLQKRGLYEPYNAEINKLLQKGFAEEVPKNPKASSERTVWYLPHHLVLNPKKPGKLRVVFDCAACFDGESLNDKCQSGPDLLNRLFCVLVRFRQHAFAFSGDVEAMYMQVAIPPEQRDALRFLWYSPAGEIITYRMTRHLFGGIWCSSSSTYALRKSLHLDSDVPPSAAVQSVVLNSFYVDDCLHSSETTGELVHAALGARDVLLLGGFRLTKFVANCSDLLEKLPADDCISEGKDFCSDSKVLGVRWDVGDDVFYFQLDLDISGEPTKRDVMCVLSSIYDPLGFLTPFVLRGKIIFQETVRLKLGWSDVLPESLLKPWKDWINRISAIVCNLRIPRCIKPCLSSDCVCELHIFSDASERALGCCAYMRCVDRNGFIHVSLICSKSKVAPIKTVSIPRLELDAAVMSVKIECTLRAEMSIDLGPSFFWTDSEIVLKYIANESSRFMTFVENRVSVIRSVTDLQQWHHIPSQENIADVITRGLPASNNRWLQGPAFLHEHRSNWKWPEVDLRIDCDSMEVKKSSTALETRVVEELPIDRLASHYSSWVSLKKAVAWWWRLMRILRHESVESDCLKPSELRDAETFILRHVQHSFYRTEIGRLSDSKSIPTSSSIIALDPFLDDAGLLRVGGRLRHAREFYAHPVLIPHRHPVANLIAKHHHDEAHLGTEWVVSRIREKFWITHARSVVKNVRHDCRTCRRLFDPHCEQMMADLPPFRVSSHEPPFSNVGIDCFGPFLVKRARSEVKRYGCIFSCMVTRAIHLEMIDCLDTNSFLNAFRRFVARRGMPKRIISDNGTNFVGARRAMFATNNDVEWIFQPPHASHMNGAWERLIRTVRKVLVGIVPRNIPLTDESFRTLLCEVERIVNSRPLTKVSDDVSDSAALTPNHILLLNHCPVVSPGSFSDSDIYRQRWRCVQHLADVFWQKWLREYLPELQRRSKWRSSKRNAAVGDVMLVQEDHTPRGVWPLGLVTEVKRSSDDKVRSCKLRLKNGSELWRPITKCVFLEGTHDQTSM